MLAVVKTPRTNMHMRGFIPMPVLRVLRHEFGENLTVTADKDDKKLESVFDSSEYKEFKNRVSPADYIRTYRENAGLSQTELAEKLNVTRAYICDVEHGRRAISKQFAKQLADFFKISIAHLI
jgi:ribosome-binding protein aMBF1 (putative translation factor)